ncbi:MAG TPA: GTP 3',8-cyclase MoaA [Bacteriovoracaceae bacterium]|nr:GTP 3',8-cyclase MoaA [Bacteriovoracaceae bacterium]
MQLIDEHGRRIRKLRLSLTDKCNLRCHYCMPTDQAFMDEDRYLSTEEYFEILEELSFFGVEEIRLTGGEPLMRKSFMDIARKLGSLPFKKIGLTTNGILLDKFIDVLVSNRIFHINISLDSLDEENFKRITFGNYFSKVLTNIRLAKAAGLVVKVNTVIMKGINDHELLDFVKFSKEEQVEVRFLELMRIGYACKNQDNQFIAASELIKKIKEQHELKSVTVPQDATSFNFVTQSGAHIGFIASESQPFCGQCSRWRLSADGILRACLLKDDGRSIRQKTNGERLAIYHELLGMKPFLRPLEVSHHMNSIGG